jgi:hypothetical protein
MAGRPSNLCHGSRRRGCGWVFRWAKRALPDGRVVVARYKMIVHETRRSIKTSYTLHVGLAASNCRPGDKKYELSPVSDLVKGGV